MIISLSVSELRKILEDYFKKQGLEVALDPIFAKIDPGGFVKRLEMLTEIKEKK